ncbi:DUF4349 domain-containing protein [Paenibacillus hexagrammi]|uniref:DUF4349 domain-containing protein n=1 Tax=Paenibacillus hexagrammi TaxID=2908839 RepID=A0ABY3SM49_9BACL|nr:DUF4349 domain-containing protein [Paenibacillus sp. YPD9-1]UJF35129.1 DUF4349 domain-containing protein [Paenibacillus sp. YPD9-1]
MRIQTERETVALWCHKGTGWKRRMSGLCLTTLLVAAILSGCGSSGENSTAKSAGAPKAEAQSASAAAEPAKVTGQSQQMGDRSPLASAEDKALASTSSESNTTTSPSQTSVVPAAQNEGEEGFNRKLIYHANLVMPVTDYVQSETKLRDLVALSGGYILQFSENAGTSERGGTFTIKVPAKGFVSLLDGLESISPSLQRNVQGQDVTEEYVDLESRLKAKQMVETRLLSFMEKASKTDDLLAFSNELSKVQEEIEQIKGRMRYLDQNVAYSTIELRMYQQTGNKPLLSDPNELSLSERIGKAWYSSLNILAAVLQGILIFLAAALPVVVILAVILLPIWWNRRRKKRQLASIRSEIKEQNAAKLHESEENESK